MSVTCEGAARLHAAGGLSVAGQPPVSRRSPAGQPQESLPKAGEV